MKKGVAEIASDGKRRNRKGTGNQMKRGNVAVITGASSGMGREFARQIAQGYRSVEEIWLIARREERLLELKEQLLGRRVKILTLDLTKQEGLDALQEALEQEKPRIRVLVNAAGYGMIGKVETMDRQDSIGMVDLNCRALTAITCMALPYMAEGSNILQMASSAAFMPQPKFAVYAASKSYVLSFSRALSQELRPRGITVTAACPGPVKTEFFDIAETYEAVKIYKKLTMAKADRVVRQALLDAKHQKSVSVYGGLMQGFRMLCKILPHSFLMKFIR